MTRLPGSDSVSVVIPTYNRARWIGRTIASILDQSVAPSEVVIVDDGSVDDTEAECLRFGDRVRYVRQQNGGVSRARNHGASLATSRWVAFCDSDDVWHPQKLALQIAAIRATGAAWSITSPYLLDLEDVPVPGRSGFEFVFSVFREQGVTADAFFSGFLQRELIETAQGAATVYHGDAYPALFLGNFGLPSSALVDRAQFLEVGGFDEAFRLAEETEFFHRLSARATVAILMSPLVGYRIAQSDSLMSSENTGRLIRNALRSIRSASRLREPGDPRTMTQLKLGESSLLTKLARIELLHGSGTAARSALKELWATGGAMRLTHLLLFVASMLPLRLVRSAYPALPARLRSGRRA